MKNLQHKSPVYTFLLVIVLHTLVWIQAATAQLSLSTPTDVQCYGDPVTLVCTHPVLPQVPEYLQADVTWMRDGTPISTEGLGQIKLNSTTTRLQFTISEDTVGNYTCFLVNAVRGGINESNSASVRPLDPRPPSITEVVSDESSITTIGTYSSGKCYSQEDSRFQYSFEFNVDNIGQGSTNVSSLNYTFPADRGKIYTISVTAFVTVSGVQLKSQPFSFSVTAGEPSTVCQNMTSRYNEPFVLTCIMTTGDELDKWRINGSIFTVSDGNYTIEGSELKIHNVQAAIFWNSATRFECSVSEGGVTYTGSPYMLDPEETLFVPNLLSNSSTQTTISLTWEDLSVYFKDGSFNYSLRWRVNGTVDWLHSTSEEVRNPNFTIPELNFNTPYEILLTVSNNSVSVNRTFILSTSAAIPKTGPVNTIAIGAGAAVGVVATILICAVIILTACVLKHRIFRRCNTIFIAKPIPESASHDVLEREVSLQGARSIMDQQQTVSQRTGHYADLDFSGYGPLPAPSQEKVKYTEVENKPIKDVDTSPELPPKQDQQQIKAFRDDVKAVLDKNGVICKDLEETMKKKGMKKDVFTAKFNCINFAASCVHTSSDLNINHVHMVIEAKQVTGSTKGLLISNQSTIPSECLLTLEDAGCQFVPVSGYGEEGWEDRMVDKFKDVFSGIDNNDSERKDLPTPEQETSPPPGDDSESEDLRIPEQVVDSSAMVLPTKASPPSDYQGGYSGVTSDDNKTHNEALRSPPGDTIVSGQYSVPMPSITSGLLVSPFEYKLSDEEEEVLHKWVPQEAVMEEEAMSVPVQETTQITCPPPSTATSIANLEYPEEPLPTAASVASGECPEMLPMALTESSHEYPDLPRADDPVISPEPDSLSYEHTDVNDMETLSNSKMKEFHCISVFSSRRTWISYFCETQSCFETLAHSELVPEEENKDSITVQRTYFWPEKKTPTQFSGKIYGFLGGLETALDPSQQQQNWGLWTNKETESVQCTSTVKDDVVYNDSGKLSYTLVHWSAHLFQTALHHSGALFVLRQRL